jgi:histidinol-phosphate aminotransferase
MKIEDLLRDNIRHFTPYRSARDEYSGSKGIFLDANENSLGSVSLEKANRYPDPYQWQLKKKIAALKNLSEDQIFLGNGSDEAIDLLIRAFCQPGEDEILLMPPTYGMYGVCADLNDIKKTNIPLTEAFTIDLPAVLTTLSKKVKLVFICSPNNPSGNCFDHQTIKTILEKFKGLVVIDEAYIDFSPESGWMMNLGKYENLIILQTFSKAWGMAGLRLGMAIAHPSIINILNHIKYPYNINILTQQAALKALEKPEKKDRFVKEILEQRYSLIESLSSMDIVEKIHPSDANFLLVRFRDSQKIFQFLLDKGIIVRDRSGMIHCSNCLRITVGTAEENKILIDSLQKGYNF